MTIEPSDSTRVRSTMQTASAPGGNGAPVMMRTDSPADTKVIAFSPAITVPTTRRRAGGLAVSAARTAYPSMDEFANGGTDSAARMDSARHMTGGVPHCDSLGGEDSAGGENGTGELQETGIISQRGEESVARDGSSVDAIDAPVGP